MAHLAELTQRVVILLRDHFQIENEPPPPCPNSIWGWMNLMWIVAKLRNTLPKQATDFSSNDGEEIYRHELIERLHTVTTDLYAHIYGNRFGKGQPGGLASIPPVPQQTFISFCWAAQRLRELDASAEPATVPSNGGTASKAENQAGRVMLSELQWPAHITTDSDRRKFLDDHKADIPNESKGRRRMVDAAAFARYWAKAFKTGLDSLESAPPDDTPIMPETISAGEMLENVVPLLQLVAGTKTKSRRQKP